jgi:hypothetical protein
LSWPFFLGGGAIDSPHAITPVLTSAQSRNGVELIFFLVHLPTVLLQVESNTMVSKGVAFLLHPLEPEAPFSWKRTVVGNGDISLGHQTSRLSALISCLLYSCLIFWL